LSFADAAERVLDEFAGRKPMHYRAVTAKILELGLVKTQGLTPDATLYAQMMSEVQRSARRGDTPRFARHGKGYWGLSCWMASGLAFQIEQHNAEVRRQLLARLMAMPPADFETLVSRLLVALGFEEVSVTQRSGDGGIDVRGTLVVGAVIRTRMAVQAKRWRANVQAPIVQQVRGSLGTHDQGLIITTSDFSAGARAEAERPNAVPVALMNGEQLVALLVEHNIGVRRAPYDLLELGDAEDE
jgi:restriction system protein